MAKGIKAVTLRTYRDGETNSSEVKGICVVCNKKVKKENREARIINGLWICSMHCIDRFLQEKKRWAPENWDEICSLQLLYQERKQKEDSLLSRNKVRSFS